MRLKQPVYAIDNFSIENNDLIVNETVFHNANGYIGIRSNFEEGYPDYYDTILDSYINGFYDVADMSHYFHGERLWEWNVLGIFHRAPQVTTSMAILRTPSFPTTWPRKISTLLLKREPKSSMKPQGYGWM